MYTKSIQNKRLRLLVSVFAVICSSLLQAYVLQAFVEPANLLSSGFTGVAILINKITLLNGVDFSISLGMICLNLPVALFCYKSISPKFTILSCIQVALTSILLQICDFQTIFQDILLNVVFGGFLYGLCTVIALKANASTGGTDFIALYVSNRLNKPLWQYVFIFNAILLIIFGFLFGWLPAGYSIIFQFIATKTISTFYHRYKRMTLQITTTKANSVIDQYVQFYHHGISCIEAIGGYSKKQMYILHTVVSSYEVNDVVYMMKEIDPNIIINVFETEEFYGSFYQAPID